MHACRRRRVCGGLPALIHLSYVAVASPAPRSVRGCRRRRVYVDRWAAMGEKPGARDAMPNLYSQEAEAPRALRIVRDLLARLEVELKRLGGADALPALGGWHALAGVEGVDGDVAGEASSSESEDDDAAEVPPPPTSV